MVARVLDLATSLVNVPKEVFEIICLLVDNVLSDWIAATKAVRQEDMYQLLQGAIDGSTTVRSICLGLVRTVLSKMEHSLWWTTCVHKLITGRAELHLVLTGESHHPAGWSWSADSIKAALRDVDSLLQFWIGKVVAHGLLCVRF